MDNIRDYLARIAAPATGTRYTKKQKKTGRRSKFGRSNVLRQPSLERQIEESYRQERPSVPIPDDAIILPDSNVVLATVGFDGHIDKWLLEFVMRSMDRVRLCSVVKSEVHNLLAWRGTDEMYGNLAIFDGTDLKYEPDHTAELAHLKSQQISDIEELTIRALIWLYAKRSDVEDVLGMQHPAQAAKSVQRRALWKVFSKSANDRILTATATAIAKRQTVALVSADHDILLFAPPAHPAPGIPQILSPAQLIMPPVRRQI